VLDWLVLRSESFNSTYGRRGRAFWRACWREGGVDPWALSQTLLQLPPRSACYSTGMEGLSDDVVVPDWALQLLEEGVEWRMITKGVSTESTSTAGERISSLNSPQSRNAEYVRRYREKRKRELSNLKQENEELEMRREMYLSRIAKLQTEVEALRRSGEADLKKENELLKIELKKARAFVQTLLRAAEVVPDIVEEERARLFREGTRSAFCQGIGMAYTSLDWKEVRPCVLSASPMHVVNFRCQFLPHGPSEHWKRINLRSEEDFSAECGIDQESIFLHQRRLFTDLEFLNASVGGSWSKDGIKRRFELLLEPSVMQSINELLGNEQVRVFKYIEESASGARSSSVLFVSMSKPSLNVQSFAPSHDNLPEGLCECNMISAFSGASVLESSGLLDDTFTGDAYSQCQIIIPHKNDKGALLLTISSKDLGGSGIRPEDIVTDDNEIDETYKEILRTGWETMLLHYRNEHIS